MTWTDKQRPKRVLDSYKPPPENRPSSDINYTGVFCCVFIKSATSLSKLLDLLRLAWSKTALAVF